MRIDDAPRYSERRDRSRVTWRGAVLLLTAAILPVRAEETIEAYVMPLGGMTACWYSNRIYETCTGISRFAAPAAGVELDPESCEAKLLTGFWAQDGVGCWLFVVSDVVPTTPVCPMEPVLRIERESPGNETVFWSPLPCVDSFDLVYTYGPGETPLSMDQFQCGLDNVESDEISWGGIFPPGYMGAVLIRSQQGQLATDHYGLSSSGEPRRPLSDCDVDLAGQPPPSQRTRCGSVPAFIP